MRPFIEKLHLDDTTSFYARMHRTPEFEVTWHQHPELELIGFAEGYGTAYVGNTVERFRQGDVFLLGSNLPHTFQKADAGMMVAAMVIQFNADFLGEHFMQLPECKALMQLLIAAQSGLKLQMPLAGTILTQIMSIAEQEGLPAILALLQALQQITAQRQYVAVSSLSAENFIARGKERIDDVYRYTIANFHTEIRLQDMADIANLTVPAFCGYFKKITRKTYVQFLNEVRIGHACKKLAETEDSIRDICFASGYNTPANFNKQFMRIIHLTPMQYRLQMGIA